MALIDSVTNNQTNSANHTFTPPGSERRLKIDGKCLIKWIAQTPTTVNRLKLAKIIFGENDLRNN